MNLGLRSCGNSVLELQERPADGERAFMEKCRETGPISRSDDLGRTSIACCVTQAEMPKCIDGIYTCHGRLHAMQISFGKHFGRSVEETLLKFPDYILWAISEQNPTAGLRAVCDEARRLIGLFNAKPFTQKCSQCERPATRSTMFKDSPRLVFWCDHCDPCSAGASRHDLSEIRNYLDVRQVGRRDDAKYLIRELAQAKGLPSRVTQAAIAAFFAAG